ncbi:hypothetical protein KSP39_PZI013109 [Platanthera zijinensis]|uniref:Uncharacterized protein n=1 Tax=Platanthera zijinensis TaxID=2320716 RepID=A0AAP0G485_9ASPA
MSFFFQFFCNLGNPNCEISGKPRQHFLLLRSPRALAPLFRRIISRKVLQLIPLGTSRIRRRRVPLLTVLYSLHPPRAPSACPVPLTSRPALRYRDTQQGIFLFIFPKQSISLPLLCALLSFSRILRLPPSPSSSATKACEPSILLRR